MKFLSTHSLGTLEYIFSRKKKECNDWKKASPFGQELFSPDLMRLEKVMIDRRIDYLPSGSSSRKLQEKSLSRQKLLELPAFIRDTKGQIGQNEIVLPLSDQCSRVDLIESSFLRRNESIEICQ